MKIIYLVILLLLSNYIFSQNLVPNPGFENYHVCPYIDSIENAPPWYNPTSYALGASPNLFNECDSVSTFSVPDNGWGFQYPRTGKGYAGFIVYADYEQGREYISVKLDSALELNRRYVVKFYVSVSDNSLFLESMYAIDRMGAYLSDTAIHINSDYIIPVIPQIENTTGHFLSDTVNWMLVSGIYTAHGGEQYLTIGNFYADDSTNYLKISNNNTHFSFYYIDDVWVSLSTDTLGLNEVAEKEIGMDIYPNPASDNVTIESPAQATIQISNIQGQLIKTLTTSGTKTNVDHVGYSSNVVDVSEFPSGVYIVEVKTEKGVAVKKFVKE